MSIRIGGGSGGAAGSDYTAILITNTGSTCTLQGYPGVSYVAGADGHQVGNPAVRSLIANDQVHVVTLVHGALAHANLQTHSAGVYLAANCRPVAIRGLRIYPPGQKAAAFLASPSGASACAAPTIRQLAVGPVAPGEPTD